MEGREGGVWNEKEGVEWNGEGLYLLRHCWFHRSTYLARACLKIQSAPAPVESIGTDPRIFQRGPSQGWGGFRSPDAKAKR